VPVYLSSIKGLNSVQIGQYLFVTGVFQFLSAPCAGFLAKKIDLRIILAFGMFMFGVSCMMCHDINYNYGFDEFFWPQALRGFSLMFCFVPITSLTFATLDKDSVQTASGLYNLMRNLGGAIGLAISNTWIQNWTKENYLHLRKNIDATDNQVDSILKILQNNFAQFNYFDDQLASVKLLYQLAIRESYIITFGQVFVAIGILYFLSLLLMPFISKVDFDKIESSEGH